MKPVMQAIFRAKRDYARLPLFEYLRDDSLTPRQRFAFYRCMAPFILTFGDLNRYVMRDESSDDPYQQLVNAHTYEDDHHWPWYLEDLEKLGLSAPETLADSLRFLYGDGTRVNRLLGMKLAHLLYGATPIERIVIIEAIEETGNVLFALTAEVARRFQREEGVELRYLGEFHFNLETGHAMNDLDHQELARIPLDAAQRERCLQLVDLVFACFREWTGELLRFAHAETGMAGDAESTEPLEAAAVA